MIFLLCSTTVVCDVVAPLLFLMWLTGVYVRGLFYIYGEGILVNFSTRTSLAVRFEPVVERAIRD